MKYNVITVKNYLQIPPRDKFVILRHDVDRKPLNALKMAKLEHKMGINATYYFRYNPETFNKEIIKEIFEMGHEIGYHYEALSKANGDKLKAKIIFEKELNEYRKICPINTVSMHGKPLSKYNDSELWSNLDFKVFDLLGDGSLSIKDVLYFTDTGRSWDNKNNIRDHTQNQSSVKNIKTTDDLIEIIQPNKYSKLYISCHPERWSENFEEWMLSVCTDQIMNSGKVIIRLFRRNK
jgi:hypothetical protein